MRDAAVYVNAEFYVIRELVSPEAKFWRHIEYDPDHMRDLRVHIRGSVTQLGEVVPRRFVAVLCDGPPEPFRYGSGRWELAEAIFSDAASLAGRVIVNRVWKRLLGRGLVEPVDMIHEGNPATHPQLLDLLADDFAAHDCDLRRLIAVIMQSETYARSSRWPVKEGLPNEQLYAVAILKPLDADQLALSLPLATGYYDLQLTGTPKRTMACVCPPHTSISVHGRVVAARIAAATRRTAAASRNSSTYLTARPPRACLRPPPGRRACARRPRGRCG